MSKINPWTKATSLTVASMVLASVFAIVGLTMITGTLNHAAFAGTFPGTNGKIIFERHRSSGIYAINPDGTGEKSLSTQGDHTPNWSSDGRKIVFSSLRDGNSEIYIMNADGTNQMRLTNNGFFDFRPSWSPDGKKIAFTSTRDSYAIYVMNSDGTNLTRLTVNSINDYAPSWSPDGTTIAFTSDRDGLAAIYLMNADGTGQRALTGIGYSYPSWSPDGKKIAFVEGAENDIFVINADGTGLTRLTDSPGRDTHPSWSPDGTKIVFATDRDLVQEPGGGLCFCNLQIYVMNADGTNQTRITHSTTQDNEPSWGVAIDDSPPDTTITSASYHHGRTLTNGQHIRQATVTFTFNGRDNVGISGFECKLDSGSFSKCSSPVTYKVSNGVHTFKVKAIDLSGNPDPTPATFTWTRGK